MTSRFSGDCPHRPRCPLGTPRWRCGQRTQIEQAVFDGRLERAAGRSLLQKLGVQMRPETATERYQRDTKRPTDQGLF